MDDYEGMSHFETAASMLQGIENNEQTHLAGTQTEKILIAQTHALLSIAKMLYGIYNELVYQNRITKTVSGLK